VDEGPITLLGLVHWISGILLVSSDFRHFKDYWPDFRDSKYSKGFKPDFKEFRSGIRDFRD